MSTPETAQDEPDTEGLSTLEIDGETVEIGRVFSLGNGGVEVTELGSSCAWIVFPDSACAGQAARDRWAEMAHNDPEEFRCMVGTECLARWALGQSAGPGSVQVTSLSEWLDLFLDRPEEEFASYDGIECDVDDVSEEAADEIGFTPGVAYRCN